MECWRPPEKNTCRTNGKPHALTQGPLGAYTYDARGRQDTAPRRALVMYNERDLPRKITSSSGEETLFAYDASGARVKKQGPGGEVVTLGGLYERRTVAGHIQHIFYVTGGDEGPVARVVSEQGDELAKAKAAYLHHDPLLGSVVAVSGAGGALKEAFYYEPFGQRTDAQGKPLASAPSEVGSGFTGQEHDEALELINFRGRMYDPVIRRFLSADPHVTHPLSGQSYNRYSYVANDPTNLIDPTGFDDIGQEYGGWGTEYTSGGFESTYGNDYSGCFTRVDGPTIYRPSGFSGSASGGNGAGAPVQAVERQRQVSMPTGPSAPAGAIIGPVVNAGTGGDHVYVDVGGGASVDVAPPVPFMTTMASAVWNMKAIHDGDISPVGVVVSSVRGLYDGVVVPVKDWAIDMHGNGPHRDHSEAMSGALGTVVLAVIMPGEGGVVGTKGPAATRELAQQIANIARYPMKYRRTITLLETREGPTLVAGGASDLSPAQTQLARELGLTPAPPRASTHAEETAIYGAGDLGLTPTRGVTTNAICTGSGSCTEVIESLGGRVIDDIYYEF